MLNSMSVQTLVPIEEYLKTSYSPDREYRDGVGLERKVGSEPHSWLQSQLAHYLNRRQKQWKVRVYTELRIKVPEDWYPISRRSRIHRTYFQGWISFNPSCSLDRNLISRRSDD